MIDSDHDDPERSSGVRLYLLGHADSFLFPRLRSHGSRYLLSCVQRQFVDTSVMQRKTIEEKSKKDKCKTSTTIATLDQGRFDLKHMIHAVVALNSKHKGIATIAQYTMFYMKATLRHAVRNLKHDSTHSSPSLSNTSRSVRNWLAGSVVPPSTRSSFESGSSFLIRKPC